jgi:hypothetical protein
MFNSTPEVQVETREIWDSTSLVTSGGAANHLCMAAERKCEGNRMYQDRWFAAASRAYSEALDILGGATGIHGPGSTPMYDSTNELVVACHANRAACFIAMAEELSEEPELLVPWQSSSVGAPFGWTDLDGSGTDGSKLERLAVCVAEWGGQSAQLNGLTTRPPLAAVDEGSQDCMADELALVIDGAATPIELWATEVSRALHSQPDARAVFIVGPDDMLRFPPPHCNGAVPVLVPVVCLRRDEGALLLSTSLRGCRLRFTQPAEYYHRAVRDCEVAIRLCAGHRKALLRQAIALEALGLSAEAESVYCEVMGGKAAKSDAARLGARRTQSCSTAAAAAKAETWEEEQQQPIWCAALVKSRCIVWLGLDGGTAVRNYYTQRTI